MAKRRDRSGAPPWGAQPMVGVALAGAVVLVLGQARGAEVLGFDPAIWRTWRATTDPATAIAPLFLIAVVGFAGVGAALGCGYLGLRAMGWARAAHWLGALVVPQLRARLDRTVALGALSALIVASVSPSMAAADVVREPESIVADDSGGVVDREVGAGEALRTPERAGEPDDHESPVRETVPEPSSGPTPGPTPAAPLQQTPVGPPRIERTPTVPTRSEVPAAAQPRIAEPGPSRVHTVEVGENLWTIAAHQLAQARSIEVDTLSDREVATYWVRVVDANRSTLRSGNPSLIYAGEVLNLPPPP